MINLLLVEDEPPILRDIKIELEQYRSQFNIAATAFNGKEALDYLESAVVRIDVLITDIEMPVIGGLELIQKVKELYPSILCVILTGYSSFSYAKKAITLGVYDYLLKPIDEAALKSLLDSIHHKIYKEQLESSLYRPADNTVLDGFDSSTYITCILCIGTFSLYSDYAAPVSASAWQQLNIEAFIEQHLPDVDSYWIIDGKTENEKNIIFTVNRERTFDIASCFQSFFLAMQGAVPYMNVITAFPVKNMNEIGSSIQKLRKEFINCFVLGRSQLFLSPVASEIQDSLYQYLHTAKDNLVLLFRQMNFPGFKKSFKAFISFMDKNSCPENTVFQFLYDLTNSCMADFGSSLPRYLKNCISLINDIFVLSDSFQALSDNMLSLYEDLFYLTMNSDEEANSQNQIMLRIDSYIKLNYTRQINTQTLSHLFNFSPAYLSKLFREYKDISPAEYIINLRMEKAKQLFLAAPSARIQDVAAQVGYEDALYFSKVFKKSTGLSPKEFVKIMTPTLSGNS